MAARKPPDPKVAALRARGCLHPRPDAVRDPLFSDHEFFDARDLVQVKYEMLRRSRVDGQPVAASAAAFGFSRPTFYEAQAAFERAGLHGLVPAKPGPRRAHKLSDEIVDFLEKRLADDGELGAADLADLVEKRFGRNVHPRSVERALARREKKRRSTPGPSR
jgi:transposase